MKPTQTEPPDSSRLWTGQFVYAIVTSFGLYLGYQGLLVFTPYYVAATGSGDATIGLVTGATMLAATATPLAMASLLARYDARILLLASVFLIAVPSLLNPLTSDPLVVSALHFVRGIGLGIANVGCGTVVATLAPSARRGEAMGWWGFTGGVTTVIGPSASLFLASVLNLSTVFIIMGAFTLLTVVSISRLSPIPPVETSNSASGILWAVKRRELLLPFFLFACAALTYGSIITFAPLYLTNASLIPPAIFFFILGSVFAFSRLAGGAAIDRAGTTRLLPVALILSGSALVLFSSTPFAGAIVIAAIVYGIGFGITATAALVTLVSRVSIEGYGTANSLFALAFNGGIGVGGVLFGVIAQGIGYSSMFLSTALCFVAAGVLLCLDQYSK